MMGFTTEDEWQAAYSAAYTELLLARANGRIDCTDAELKSLSAKVVTVAIRNAQSVAPDDIANLPGIHVERITIERVPSDSAA
jgi:hypothetical protein